ncbi:MAG: hypothetical protein ABI874_13830 [Chloroflexota bacterium]
MSRSQPVDREPELALFDRMIAVRTTERILLLRASGGIGKSTLIGEFRKRCPARLPIAHVDFKNGGGGQAELFARICDKLGRARFPNVTAAIRPLISQSSVNISDNTMLGRAAFDIALGGADEKQREFQLAEVTSAFCDDLRALGRAVLLFDTFEDCDASLRKWIGGALLGRVELMPELVVVIAGREVPPLSSEWQHLCHEVTLEGMAHEHWHHYAEAIGATVTLEFVHGCCVALQGNSLFIAGILERETRR